VPSSTRKGLEAKLINRAYEIALAMQNQKPKEKNKLPETKLPEISQEMQKMGILFFKNETGESLDTHIFRIITLINSNYSSNYSYCFPEDLSGNDSRACAGFPVYLVAGEYRIIYLDEMNTLNVNNTGKRIVKIILPDLKLELEFDLQKCNIFLAIQSAGEYLKEYQIRRKKRQREV